MTNNNNSTFPDDDDEFGGAMVDINQLRARAVAAKQEENTSNRSVKTPTLNETFAEVLKLPDGWDEIATDAEYLSQTDKPTVPCCISVYSAKNHAEYLHPNSHTAKFQPILMDVRRKMKLLGEMQSLRVFKTPFVFLDFLQDTYKIQWRAIKDLQRQRVKTLKIYFFFSFKDLQFLWAKDADFLHYCLAYLERIRRITTKFNKPIALPYEIYLPTQRGMKWHALSLEVVDICAMQGSKSLQIYLQNVGLPDETKDLWDWDKNNNPMDFLMFRPKDFLTYIRGDVKYLKQLYTKTIEFYNDIAATVSVKPSDDWGLSTGKITARIASEWLAARPNVMVPTSEALSLPGRRYPTAEKPMLCI